VKVTTNDIWMAARLHALDGWPVVVSDPRVWDRLAFEEPFDFRWNDKPVPDGPQRAYDAIAATRTRIRDAAVSQRLRSISNRRIERHRTERDCSVADCNTGRGGRVANTLQVALTVDTHLDGFAASAMPWNNSEDPILVVDVHDVASTIGALERAANRAEATERAVAWGPGAKGIVSVRDADHAFHRVFNVMNHGGVITFVDYSRAGTDDAVGDAAAVLAALDGGSPFAGIQMWRTTNMAGWSRLPDDVLDRQQNEATRIIADALPSHLDAEVRAQAADKVVFFDNFDYAVWLLERAHRGACTFLTPEVAALGSGVRPEPVTECDRALVGLAERGRVTTYADEVEITINDGEGVRATIAGFDGAAVRSGPIDGLPSGVVQIVLNESCLAGYDGRAPALAAEPAPDTVAERHFSWIDVNRVISPGQRKTNCWNASAAVAELLRAGAPSTALPIYPKSSFRPTIPQYLEAIGIAEPVTFVADGPAAADLVRSWPDGTHGLVVASLNDSSTHMFNVVLDAGRVRYLDGYIGREGDYNFDITWQRIGVARIGPVTSDLFAADLFTSGADVDDRVTEDREVRGDAETGIILDGHVSIGNAGTTVGDDRRVVVVER